MGFELLARRGKAPERPVLDWLEAPSSDAAAVMPARRVMVTGSLTHVGGVSIAVTLAGFDACWLRAGRGVDVRVGVGPDRGVLRIERNDAGGRTLSPMSGGRVCCRFPAGGVSEARIREFPGVEAAFTCGEDWLAVTLPAMLFPEPVAPSLPSPPEPVQVRAPAPPARPEPARPFSLSAPEIDPVAARRRGCAPIPHWGPR